MPFPKPPEKIVPFNSGPVAPHDIGRQFDEHARAASNVIDFLRTVIRDDGVVRREALPARAAGAAGAADVLGGSKEPTLPVGVLGPNAGGFYAADDLGATATSSDYAQVSIDWAEYMPTTIPPNILAINAITGDHWSSRWWANKAASLVSALMQGGAGVVAEQVAVTAPNTLAVLSNAPIDAATTMQLIVNGKVFSGCATPPPFSVAGKVVTWLATAFGIVAGDVVVARYRYAVTPVAAARVPAISLYYLATQGQTAFLLSTPDRFALSYVLHAASKLQVSRNGSRLMPDDGTGKGAYTVSVPGNGVTLLWPAGVDETVTIDVWEPA